MGMSKYDRLLHILNLLRARKNMNAAALARECGVTERSVYRDIISLSEANIPIYYDHGYRLASDNFLPPLNFDYEEYHCLRLALDSSPLARTGYYAEVLRRVRAKVDAGVSETVKKLKRSAPEVTNLEIPMTGSSEGSEQFYRTLESGIADDLRIRMTYESIESGITERIVEPYFIVFKARAFYFVAYCLLREELRTFRIDRVSDMTLTDEHFVRKIGINPRDYFEGSWEIYSGDATEVVVRFANTAARVVKSTQHHPLEQIVEIDQDNIEYRVTVNGLEEIKRWILGFGEDAEVVYPLELKKELAQLGGFLQSIYN